MRLVHWAAGVALSGSVLVGVMGTGAAYAHKTEASEPAPVPSASQRFSYNEPVTDDQWGFNCLTMGNRVCGSEFRPLSRENRVLVRGAGLSPRGAVERVFQVEGEYDVLEISVPRSKGHPFGVVLYF